MRLHHGFACLVLLGGVCLAPAQDRIDCGDVNSEVLHRAVRYCALLPPGYVQNPGRKYPVLYFLHGLGESEQLLLRIGTLGVVEDLRRQHKIGDFLMIAPDGAGTFFINSVDGKERYSDFFLHEFLPYIEAHFRVVRSPRARAITGLSMGGYGALRFAFSYPGLFGSVSAQSPALITESPQQMNRVLRNGGPLAQLLGSVFGNPVDVRHWSDNNPFDLARINRIRIRAESIYINCGAQDEYGFASGASRLHEVLVSQGIRHEFHLYPGGHSADYFLNHLGETLEFHARAFARP